MEVKCELGKMSRRKVRIAYYRVFLPMTWLRTACHSQWYPRSDSMGMVYDSSEILFWMNWVGYAHLANWAVRSTVINYVTPAHSY